MLIDIINKMQNKHNIKNHKNTKIKNKITYKTKTRNRNRDRDGNRNGYRKMTRNRYSNITNKLHNGGGNFLNSISESVIKEKTDMKTTSPLSSLSKSFTNVKNMFDSNQSNNNKTAFFRIIYNYRTPNPIDIDQNKNNVLYSTYLSMEPYILPSDNRKYLVSLVEGKPPNKLLWLALFNLRSKVQTILTYKEPYVNGKPNTIQTCSFMFYLITDNALIYKPLEMTNPNRNQEFINFMIYLNQNKQYIITQPEFTKIFQVQTSSDYNEFEFSNLNAVKLAKSSMHQEPRFEKMEKMEKFH
jgi:hypothetical protein